MAKVGWKFDNKSRESRNRYCENSVVHNRKPPPQYADYASLNERNARDLEEKQIREANVMAKQLEKQKKEQQKEHLLHLSLQANSSPTEVGDGEDGGGDSILGDSSIVSGGSLEDEVWDNKVSIFGEAMLHALSGEAADPDSSDLLANQNMAQGIISPHKLFGAGMIRIESLYKYLSKKVEEASSKVREMEEISLAKRLEAEKAAVVEETKDLGEAALVKALGKWHKQVRTHIHFNSKSFSFFFFVIQLCH